MKRILINASNLHAGGAIAVATSFIKEISEMSIDDLSIYLLISNSVAQNLSKLNVSFQCFAGVKIQDYKGIRALWSGQKKELVGYDAVFTVFGPVYITKRIPSHVVGFAQPNIIYPNNPIFNSLSLVDRVKTRFKYRLQEKFFSLATDIVVELEHVKKGIEQRGFFEGEKVHVVNSAVDSVFINPDAWLPLNFPLNVSKNTMRLGLVSRNYPHKNLMILPEVKRVLEVEHNLNFDFFVTFTDEEYASCSDEFKRNIVNVGPLSLAQCPSFYSKLDGVVFPSLLECFSAVPIETMMMKKPLFASDLAFIHDCCKDFANYFSPLDAASIASSIANYFSETEKSRHHFVSQAYNFVHSYPGPSQRAKSYLDLIRNV